MRKTLSVISHILVVIFSIMTVIYNVYLFIEKIKTPEKTFFDVLALVMLVAYSAAVMRVGFELFLNAGSMAYSVGRAMVSHAILRSVATVTGYLFIIPHAVALVYLICAGAPMSVGTWLCYALLGDFALYYVFRWLSFLTDVSEKSERKY